MSYQLKLSHYSNNLTHYFTNKNSHVLKRTHSNHCIPLILYEIALSSCIPFEISLLITRNICQFHLQYIFLFDKGYKRHKVKVNLDIPRKFPSYLYLVIHINFTFYPSSTGESTYSQTTLLLLFQPILTIQGQPITI